MKAMAVYNVLKGLSQEELSKMEVIIEVGANNKHEYRRCGLVDKIDVFSTHIRLTHEDD